jgi:aspartyl-tRNA(Asn)/glutamyl-tRNA(Gln) amidotransferase subunit A
MLGTFVLSAGYYDAYYSKAQKVRRLVQEKTAQILENHDFILSPTSPTTAFKIGEKSDNPIAMYLADIFTVHANIAGVPALNIPFGEDTNGMPIGVQIMANMHEDALLLSLAEELA